MFAISMGSRVTALRHVHTRKSRGGFQSRGLQLPKEGSTRGTPS